ncbi:aminotransferase class I/II-fold pyridoxal phosphate-dependent enzyme [Formosa sediminum]|uniref:Aminotransferase class I/II-fold pyridoxal phosphate-dependent enzyme n=1 Tax=Formosa sediminum TaxID=2594004 RepID=A0A516GPY1_9FLAO|nr:aminotransferase class I/II-fold pyridoxal phosphate-dependent enzyme [Formosa sediminum]QDO93543.1 aminotransferase class I/II-fold pyridoxal phosphate-dependent enzyme [Formosa sediminum]
MEVNKAPKDKISINDSNMSYFGGTSYLGLATLPAFQEAIIKGIRTWGTAYGSSRHANVKLKVFNEAETLLASQLQTESCVTVSSGMLAGKLVLEYLATICSQFYHYPNTHPAILAANSLPLYVDNRLHSNLVSNTPETVVICTDAIPTTNVTFVNFDFLKTIPEHKKIILLVDESHSLGITGDNGMGVFNSIPTTHINQKILVSSLGKAMALPGGIIAGDANFINAIKATVMFSTASGMSPAYLEAYIQSQAIYKQQQDKLKANLEYFFKGLQFNTTFKYNYNYPNIYNFNPGFYETLLKQNIVITHFHYPTPKDVLSRIVLSANHTKADLDKLKKALS